MMGFKVVSPGGRRVTAIHATSGAALDEIVTKGRTGRLSKTWKRRRWEHLRDAEGYRLEPVCGNGAPRDAETVAETVLDGQTVQPAGNPHGA